MSNIHKLGEINQRPNESISYTVDVSNVGSSPTVNSVTAYERQNDNTWSDVSATVLSGSNTVSADVITTKLIGSLTDGRTYHIVVNYTISGETYDDYLVINCTDHR